MSHYTCVECFAEIKECHFVTIPYPVCPPCFQAKYLSDPGPDPSSIWDILAAELKLHILLIAFPLYYLCPKTGCAYLIHLSNNAPTQIWLEGPLAGKQWWYKDGIIHRDAKQGPAVELPDNSQWWVEDGQVVKAEYSSDWEPEPHFYYNNQIEDDIVLRQCCFEFYCLLLSNRHQATLRRGITLPDWAIEFFLSLKSSTFIEFLKVMNFCGFEEALDLCCRFMAARFHIIDHFPQQRQLAIIDVDTWLKSELTAEEKEFIGVSCRQ